MPCRVTSKYRGVRWHYCNSKWEARIFNGTRQISLGYYDNEAEAAAAYDAEARGLRGAAAVVNFRTAKPAATAKPPAATAAAVRPPTRRQPQPKTDENHHGAPACCAPRVPAGSFNRQECSGIGMQIAACACWMIIFPCCLPMLLPRI